MKVLSPSARIYQKPSNSGPRPVWGRASPRTKADATGFKKLGPIVTPNNPPSSELILRKSYPAPIERVGALTSSRTHRLKVPDSFEAKFTGFQK